MDILRETADKVEKYEGTIQSYQKKLEELGDLKRECKVLEGKNHGLLEQNVELEKVSYKLFYHSFFNNLWHLNLELLFLECIYLSKFKYYLLGIL